MPLVMPEYYADSLVTPNPMRLSSDAEPQQVLSGVIRNQDFFDQLAAIEDRGEYEENALAAAHIVLLQVREALYFAETKREFDKLDLEEPMTLEYLPNHQVADCFGFTIVSSECLEIAGIDHWIGFANGHATLLLPTEEGQELNLADPLSPVLSQNLQHSMVSGGSGNHSVHNDMYDFGRSAIELNTLSLATRARGDTAELLREHPWLTFTRSGDEQARLELVQAMVSERDPYSSEKLHPSKARIFMSVFLPEEGREMLHEYDRFQTAYRKGEYLDAAGILYSRIKDAYPDLDARQSHARVKTIVRELASGGNAMYARKLLDEYFESFVLMEDDSRVPEAHADCLGIVARETGDVLAANEAVEIYGKVLEYKRAYKDAVAGKFAKMTALAAQLSIGPMPERMA